ncbi:MAG: hypothetical protein KY451_02075 [Actinobacteria bacterium]|nr:hypothetical protein [Actinomycetota bacterium]MBW3647510.1 hypothetical protein [Actinomycetota bacterium]
MSEPQRDVPRVQNGTDVEVTPEDVEAAELPATSDPAAFTDDQELGGVGGGSPGGAG